MTGESVGGEESEPVDAAAGKRLWRRGFFVAGEEAIGERREEKRRAEREAVRLYSGLSKEGGVTEWRMAGDGVICTDALVRTPVGAPNWKERWTDRYVSKGCS